MKNYSKQNLSLNNIRKKRLEKLFEECKDTIINTSLSAFGLNQGMFTDHNGGNVTTLHNFEKSDKTFIQERDLDSYNRANKKYTTKIKSKIDKSKEVSRQDYTVKQSEWDELKKEVIKEQGNKDPYSNSNNELEYKKTDLDHIVPIENIHNNKKAHLAYNTGKEEGQNKIKEIANNKRNLAATSSSINRAKRSKTNKEFVEKTPESRKKELNINDELMLKKEKEAKKYIESENKKALFKKQSKELLQTGGKQALSMGIKQALGLIITDLVAITFSEIKLMLKDGIPLDLRSLNKLKNRVFNHLGTLVKKIPDILLESLKGGVSGFISNLFTFILNNFISTAKKIVTMIRESLLGIYKAFKFIFFPPQGMNKQEIWANAIKILTTTLITSGALLLSETVSKFLAGTLPILSPISEEISTLLVGIIAGLASAFVAYIIDCLFDRFSNRHDENMIDMLMENSDERNKLSDELLLSMDIGLRNISSYNKSLEIYENIRHNLDETEKNTYENHKVIKEAIDTSKETIEDMKRQIAHSKEVIKYINQTQPEIEKFLNKN